ncbi:hypothetical protein ACTMTF_06125 [Nonomuraea sp. ZG12]|uniref:WXG100-like domain-containing protein n=1 Tax=Nonomuraea sp. ZG12 TaxID=3452207 RepID=UPI003F8ADE55
MGFDGVLVPDWAKGYVGWVVGMDWPEGDETGCFRLADACVSAAHRLVEGTAADQPWTADKIGADWDGSAHLAFAEYVAKVTDAQVADVVNRLVNAAVALNGVGVQIQCAKYMIELTVWLLIAQLTYLLAASLASGGATLAIIPARVRLARMTVAQIAERTLANIAIFAGVVAAMDGGVQLTQLPQGRRDELDLRQLGISALSGGAMGGAMGLLSGGLTRLATPALRAGLTRAEMSTAERLLAAATSSLHGQAAQDALTGGLTTAGTMLAQGDFSWELLAKGMTSSALGADGQHLTTTLPRGGDPPPDRRAVPSLTSSPGPSPDPRVTDTDGGTSLSQVRHGQDAVPGRDAVPSPDAVPQVPAERPSGPGVPGETRAHTVPDQGSAPVHGAERGGAADPSPRPLDQPAPPPPREHSAPASRNATEQTADGGVRRPGDPLSGGTPRRDTEGVEGAEGAAPDVPPPGTGRGESGTAGGQGALSEPAPTSRIERLLNHVPEPGDSAPRTQPPDRTTPAAAGDVPPPPAGFAPSPAGVPPTLASVPPMLSRADGDPAPPPGQAGSRSTPARVPFDFERFYNDPRWSADATKFERRLGAHYFNDPQTLDAARTVLSKLRDVLLALTPGEPGESPAAFARRAESPFFKDDPASAGQVGTRAGLTVDDLLAHGNLRELVTAVYNAAYYNRHNPHIFGKALLRIMDTGAWDRAREVGLDVAEVRRAHHQLDERLHRPLLGRLEARFMDDSYTFARDPFGTGNVGMLSERGARDVAEMVSSQHNRNERSESEIQRLGLHTTPAHYEELGAPLGRFERALVEENVDGGLGPDTPLPWREGATAHESTSTRWASKVSGEGFLVVDGISGTTAKMLTAVKMLDLGRPTTERFLGALMGWMLPGLDHSLFEIARGAQIADVGGMRLDPGSRPSAVDFYRDLPGLDLATLRHEILPDGMFPHEHRYFANATDKAGFSETQHPKVRETVDRLWPQLASGQVTDPDLSNWLRRSGIDPADPAEVRALGERLSPAHVMALTVYTRHSHYLINNVTRTQLWTAGMSESLVRHRMVDKAGRLVGDYLDNLAAGTKALPLPMALRPMLHVGDGHLDSRSPLSPLAGAYVDAVRRTDEAKQRVAGLQERGRTQEARQAGGELRQARRDRREAWNALKERLDGVTPRLWDEMRWHADMAHDAMTRLPGVGSPESPVQAYRGDWITPVHSPIYGSRLHPHGTAREFLSVSGLLEVAIRFMAENPAGDRKVLVAYRLTGRQARDISVFSSFAEDQESVFPPHSRTRRVDDLESAARLREEADRLAADMVVRGVIPEAPRSYEIIVMEES